MKKIFMICYGGGHASIIKEVYKELSKHKEFEITILALTMAKYIFDNEHIPYKTINEYFDLKTEKEIYNLGKEFCKKNNIDTRIGKEETYLYHGYPLKELENNYSKNKIYDGFNKFGRVIFLPINKMENILQKVNPDLVITTNSPRYEKATLIAAKNLNIKTLSIEDLFGVSGIGVFRNLSKELIKFFNNNMYENIYGDCLCISCDFALKNLDKEKIKNILISGNPNFDKCLEKFNNLKEEKKFDKNEITLCYLTQNYDNKIIILKELEKIVTENRHINLIVKIHPNEKIEEYLKLVNNNKIIITNQNLYENILKSDIIINVNSTSSLEAAILDKIVIGQKNDYIPYNKMEIGVEFESPKELENIIKNVIENKELRKKLKLGRDKFRPKQLSREVIVNYIKQLFKEESK